MAHQPAAFFAAKSARDIGERLDLALLDVAIAERQDLQQRQRFLGLFIGDDVLEHRFGFAVLGDHQGLPSSAQLVQDFGGVGLQVADRLDLRRIAHGTTSHKTECSLNNVEMMAPAHAASSAFLAAWTRKPARVKPWRAARSSIWRSMASVTTMFTRTVAARTSGAWTATTATASL